MVLPDATKAKRYRLTPDSLHAVTSPAWFCPTGLVFGWAVATLASVPKDRKAMTP